MPVETERGYKVVLSFGQRRVLWMLSQRGKQEVMDPTNLDQRARDGLVDLEVKGLVRVTPLIGRTAKHYLLTDLGVQVVEQMDSEQT